MRLAEREPTMEEIVVALRETRRGAGPTPPFTVVGGQRAGNPASGAARRGGRARNGMAGSTDIADLRDAEIERLLAENARLNERIMFLLKVIERERTCAIETATATATEQAPIATDHGAISRDLRAALEAELRPIMLVLLRLLETQRRSPATEATRRSARDAARSAAPAAPPHDTDGIVDLDAQCS